MPNHNKLTKEALIGTTALAAAVVGGIAVAKTLEHSDEAHRADTIHAVKQASSEFVVLESGAKVRTDPTRIEDSGSGDTNVAFTVPNGKELLVKLPVVVKGKDGWVGFHNPQAKGNKAEDTVWANVDALVEQGKAHEYNYGKSFTVPVELQHGEFVAPHNEKLPVAEAQLGSNGDFRDDVAAMSMRD